jgi:hypothetical protein
MKDVFVYVRDKICIIWRNLQSCGKGTKYVGNAVSINRSHEGPNASKDNLIKGLHTECNEGCCYEIFATIRLGISQCEIIYLEEQCEAQHALCKVALILVNVSLATH